MAGTKKKTAKTQKTPKTKRKTRAQLEREKKRALLLDNIRVGMSIEAACSQAGVGRRTHYDWIEKDEAYAEEVNAAIGYSEAVMLSRLDRCVDDKMDWRGWAWRLSKRFPDKYGDLKQVDLNVSKQSDGSEEVLSMMKQLEAQVQNKESLAIPPRENTEESQAITDIEQNDKF